MNDPPGVSSALGIEAVEWLAEGGENLTVRVTGRWRRRRPAWGGQPTLVVEGSGRRYRFPAIAEPPSLTGTGPGMWRISFAVPAALAPELGGRAWLQFGAVIVPLPGTIGPESTSLTPETGSVESETAPEPDSAPDAGVPEEMFGSGRPSERIHELEAELQFAHAEAARLEAELADAQLARRAAEQGARAERGLRQDMARQLAARTAEAARAREALRGVEAVQARIHSLQQELERMRPAAAAPEHPAERRRRGLEAEMRLWREGGTGRIPHEPPLPSLADTPSPATPPSADRDTELAALRAELDARAQASAALQSQLVETEGRLAAREVLARRIGVVLSHLKRELEGLRAEVARDQTARRKAEARIRELEAELGGARHRSQSAFKAIAELRGSLESLRRATEESVPQPPTPNLEPDRLNEALARLREQIAPAPPEDAVAPAPAAPEPAPAAPEPAPAAPEPATAAPEPPAAPPPAALAPPAAPPEAAPSPEPTPAEAAAPPPEPTPPEPPAAPEPPATASAEPLTVGRSWLRPAFRALTRTDPTRAGRLVLELLPAQGAVHPQPIAYDLILSQDPGTVSVTVLDGQAQITTGGEPRDLAEIDFALRGDLAGLARRLTVGGFKRRFGRGVARVKGRRDGLAALDALLDTQLSLAALRRAGVTLGPDIALGLVARLVARAWIDGERFTLAYETPGAPTSYLIAAPKGLRVTDTPPDQISTTITGPAGTLEALLSGESPAGARLEGEDRALVALRRWVDRAQSG